MIAELTTTGLHCLIELFARVFCYSFIVVVIDAVIVGLAVFVVIALRVAVVVGVAGLLFLL